jgi:hypothetical protein
MRLFIVALTILLAGCTGYQYVASPQYIPLNTRKGEVKGNISLNAVQLGYTVSNHFSLFASAYERNGGTSVNFEKWGTKEGGGANSYKDHANEINAGGSYFKCSDRFIYEIHAGAGKGKVYFVHDKDLREGYHFEMNANKTDAFIQPSFSYRIPSAKQFNTENFFQFGVFMKVVGYRYYDLKVKSVIGRASGSDGADKEDLYFMNRNFRNLYFAEPGVCIRAGSKWIKGSTVLSVPVNLQGDNIRHRPLNLNISAFINFSLLKTKKA